MTDDMGGMDLSNLDLDMLEQLLSEEGVDTTRPGRGIVPRDPAARVPLSFSQELLWLLEQATPGLTAYNLAVPRRLLGALDVAALERAVSRLVERHEILRTRFGLVDGEPSQLVDAHAPVALNVVDVGAHHDRERELDRVLRERARTPFDFGREHLFRVTLVRLAPDDHVMLIETHHAVMDGVSLGIAMREIAAFYRAAVRGTTPELAPLPVQFGDYASWQREELSGARLAALLDFWRAQLGDATEPLALPTDFPPPAPPTFAGAAVGTDLSPELLSRVKALGRAHDATLYMTLLSAYTTVLHRWSGDERVLVGSGVVGRTEQAAESLVGYFNNTVVQRADFSGDPTFAALLARVRDSALAAFDHQDVPLEKLILELRDAQQRTSDAPLFRAVFTMQDPGGTALDLEGVRVLPYGVELGATKFDVTLLPTERDGGMRLSLHYRSDLFARATMERFLGHLVSVLEAAIADANVPVSRIALLTPGERAQLAAWNDTSVDEAPASAGVTSAATLVELFEAQAARVPSRAAVVAPRAGATAQGSVAGAQVLTYAELNARANQLARHLQSSDTANAPVGLLLDRSADALVGLLGILKAGAAYMPLSLEAPPARLAQQIAESGARVVVTSAASASKLPPTVTVVALDRDGDAATLGAYPADNIGSADSADSADFNSSAKSAKSADKPAERLAYVLHTSGSTGTPKGVAVTHANAVHYARAVSRVLADVPNGTPGDGFAAMDGWQFGMASTLAADLGNTSLLPSLLAGGTLHVLGKDVTTEPARFAEYAAVHQLDVLKITPNHLVALTAGRSGADLAPLLPRRWIVTGGEALRPDVARTMLGAGKARVLNHYGPTETTVGVLTHEVTATSLAAAESFGAQTVPLGRPLANTHAYVASAAMQEQPVGVPGELLLGGAGVTRGYLGRDDLTAERFFSFTPASARAERVYRTGDRVRRLADGTIEFLGRADDQVKVRGFRVELGEVESALRAHPGVQDGVVVLRAGEGGEPALVAYAVPKQAGYAVSHGDRPTGEKLQAWVAAQVPEYMVPSAVVLLDALPLTANGKVDRRALPALDATATQAADAYVAPRTPTETQLAQIWQDVLKKERVGVTDSFLELGGHSLLAIRVLGRISKTFGVRLSLRTLFDAPTVEQLAELVDVETQLAALDALGGDTPS